ncbi:5-hydroxytryptamine receptor 3A-like [Scomber japonicus]|uniref:5-hydroxytryptamine receptor 3A-like n=1 Tax=Scomber japonicus TaxID=13676 RepID=UPI0023063DDB|nr:5-hydroxytryptamine receptor 3A-like [Scomber japonicus]
MGRTCLDIVAVEGASSEDNCSYQYLLKHLNLSLSNKNDLYTMSRPVKNYETTTNVSMEMIISAILDMRESDQTFISNVWIFMDWKNEHIEWEPDDFCGINRIVVPADILWKPDLTIQEMSESYKAFQSPYLIIFPDGSVTSWSPQVLVSACKMQVHKFPFDMQSCNISFRSITHTDKELNLEAIFDSTEATEWSREVMKTQYEWLYVNMSTTQTTIESFNFRQSMIVYTITMKRRSVLYIVNFLLPILFFLCLDFSSFLISDNGGEKLSFKITVLLAVTVMQIILNEILPSSSNRAPLIAVYCLGVFGLMLLSLLETIVVMYLMEKDSESRDNEADRDQSVNEDCGDKHGKAKFICNGEKKKWTLACISDASADETPSELLKGSSSQLTEETHGAEKLSDDLREVMKTLALLHDSKKEEPFKQLEVGRDAASKGWPIRTEWAHIDGGLKETVD